MVEGLIGRKIGMTQSFDENGNVIPVTVIKAGPCSVVQKKTEEKDGYCAVQLGLIEGKEKPVSKPMGGHLKKADLASAKLLREFRCTEGGDVKEGAQFFADIFAPGELVNIIGTSKGKGFAGVIKRYGFRGGKATHGSMFHRRPGSIGQSAWPSRVIKGKKMPGHMGSEQVTVQKLQVVESDRENNLLVVRGSVPGGKGGFLLIKKADFDPAAVVPEAPQAQDSLQAEPVKAEPPKAEPDKAEPAKAGPAGQSENKE